MRFAPLVAMALQVAAAAQSTHPDFSGTWMLLSPVGGPAARSLTVRMIAEPTTPRSRSYGATISVSRMTDNGPITDNYRIGLIGGTVDGSGRTSRQSVTWQGSTLVFDTSSNSPADRDWTQRRERWRIDADGRLQIAIQARGARENYPDTVLVYERRR